MSEEQLEEQLEEYDRAIFGIVDSLNRARFNRSIYFTYSMSSIGREYREKDVGVMLKHAVLTDAMKKFYVVNEATSSVGRYLKKILVTLSDLYEKERIVLDVHVSPEDGEAIYRVTVHCKSRSSISERERALAEIFSLIRKKYGQKFLARALDHIYILVE